MHIGVDQVHIGVDQVHIGVDQVQIGAEISKLGLTLIPAVPTYLPQYIPPTLLMLCLLS